MQAVSPVESEVPGLDARAAHRWHRAASGPSPWLHEEVARRMIDRLGWFRAQPASWLHWEPLSGGVQAHRTLAERLPRAAVHFHTRHRTETLRAIASPGAGWWNPARWGWSRGAAPLEQDTQVDLLWANMQLHHEPLPQTLLKRWHRHVAIDGFLMFSCLGPDSLKELRGVYQREGWPGPCHGFTDMHDWGDMLVHSGFAEPVMDMERIVLTYTSGEAVLAELRTLGRNLNTERFPGLRGRRWRTELVRAIESGLPRTADQRLQLTFEIVYGHAFKPRPRAPSPSQQNVSLQEMRAMLRGQRP
ncbi:MAG: biotin synthase [Hydrogenophaga sp.]